MANKPNWWTDDMKAQSSELLDTWIDAIEGTRAASALVAATQLTGMLWVAAMRAASAAGVDPSELAEFATAEGMKARGAAVEELRQARELRNRSN